MKTVHIIGKCLLRCVAVVSRTGCSCLSIALILVPGGCARRSAQPPTITMVGLDLRADELLRRDALKEFSQSTGIPVEVVPSWGDSVDQLAQAVMLLTSSPPAADIYVIDMIWTGALATNLLDLSPFTAKDANQHLSTLLQHDTVGGRLVSLPFYVNLGVLYYRTDLLRKYGYREPPATWDELESMAARIQRGERAGGNPDFWGYVWQGASYEGLTCDALEWQASYGGGRIIESSGAVSVNNPAAAAALSKAASWVGKISPRGVLAYTESDSLAAFRSGDAAFLRHWTGALSPARVGDLPIRGRFDVAVLPSGPHGRAQAVGGFHLAVSQRSAHPRESAQLVGFLTGAKVQLRRALSSGYLPTIASLYSDTGLLRMMPIAGQLCADDHDEWVARPSTVTGAKYADVSRAYYQTVHDILSARAKAGQALPELERKLVSLTGFRAGRPRQ